MPQQSKVAEQLTALLHQTKRFFPEKWDPEQSGEIPIYIDNEGKWFYQGTPFEREKMVNLFAQLLRKEGTQYYLVTPVEKLRIRVEDVPFIIVDVTFIEKDEAKHVIFTTNTGDKVLLSELHPLHFASAHGSANMIPSPFPYVRIRHSLEARINRNVYYELTNHVIEHQNQWGLWSDNKFWSMECDP